MFNWFKRKKSEEKQSSGFIAFMEKIGITNLWSKMPKEKLASEGYAQNVIVYWCIERISNAVSSVPIELRGRGDKVLGKDHPISKVLERPAPRTSLSMLIKEFVIYLLISGDGYLERIMSDDGRILELHTYMPDEVEYINNNGTPTAIKVRNGKEIRIFPIDVDGKCDLLHMRLINPLDNLFGLSPIYVAGIMIDQMNLASKWNYGILDSGYVLGGILKVDSILSEGDADRYRDAFSRAYANEKNMKVAVFGRGVDYQPLTNSSIDDFLVVDKIEHVARYIALAFGIPPYLLGLKDGSTYNNVFEARQVFYNNTVIPLADYIFDTISIWLSEITSAPVKIVPQWNQVPILAERQRDTWEKIDKITFLSINEKREIAGFAPFEGGNIIVQPPNLMPVGEIDENQ